MKLYEQRTSVWITGTVTTCGIKSEVEKYRVFLKTINLMSIRGVDEDEEATQTN